MENIPNPLHQVVAEQLPLIAFIMPFGVSLVALIVPAYNAHINRIRTLRSEQIKTSRVLLERINEKYDPIIEIGKSKGWPKDQSGVIDVPWAMVRSLVGEIDYFTYLILMDEIKDKAVLRYYRHHLSSYIEVIMKHYSSPDYRPDLCDQYSGFDRLIKKWNSNLPDEETWTYYPFTNIFIKEPLIQNSRLERYSEASALCIAQILESP